MTQFFANRAASILFTVLLLFAGFRNVQAQTALWSTTPAGGAYGVGVIYRVNPDGGNLQVQHDFLNDGIDGNMPLAGLTRAGGLLYGLTSAGGTNGNGTLYSIDPGSGAYQKLIDLSGDNGSYPMGVLTLYNGLLYGMTLNGGANAMGVIFSFDPSSGVYTDLYDLNQTSGGNPAASLTLLNDQFFFTTTAGGLNGGGTLAMFMPATNQCLDLYDFAAGIYVPADLLPYKNLLCGFNANGGPSSSGQLFSFDPVIKKYSIVYQFPDPSLPATGYSPAGMVLYQNKFYGEAYSGGNSPSGNGSSGVLFSFDPATRVYADLFDFDNSYAVMNGGVPASKPVVYQGRLYGTTIYGGPGASGAGTGNGAAFRFDISTHIFQALVEFDGSHGMNPNYASLLPVGPLKTGTARQTIQSFSDSVKIYGAPNFYMGASSSSGLPVVYHSSDETVAYLVGNGIHIVGAGSTLLTVSQPGDSNYAAAAPVSVTLTVSKAPLLIKADDQIAYQDQPVPSLTIHYSGFVGGEDSSFLSSLPTASSVVDASTPHGSYPITVSGASSNNYAITYQGGTFYVYGLQQSFTVTDTVATYGDGDFAVATASSGLPVTYQAADSSIAETSVTPGRLHIKGAGSTRVAVLQAGNSHYAPGSDSVTITINRAPLRITADNQTIVYGESLPVFTVSYSGFVNGEDSSSLATKPLVQASATSEPIYPGTYLVEVSGAESNNYAFTYVNGVLVVTLPGDSLKVFVNAPGSVAVNILSTAGRKGQLALYNLAGQRMLGMDLSLQKGFNQVFLPVARLARGVYFVRVEGKGLVLRQKIWIQ